ncbi:hypothetical protein D9M71_666330 [compost metagenome]
MGMPTLQGLALLLLGLGVDVGGRHPSNGVVEQHLPNQVIHPQLGPAGASQLAQVVAGPVALPQAHKHLAGLFLGQRRPGLAREQEHGFAPTGALAIAVSSQQRHHLVGQRQMVLSTGLSLVGGNDPQPLLQQHMPPARLPRLADAGAMAQHQQSQQGIPRLVPVMLRQLLEQRRHI